jgi:DNA-directed RNA polymerase specialized sigma24 family protein
MAIYLSPEFEMNTPHLPIERALAFDSLPVLQHQVLALNETARLTAAEIGAVLGMTRAQARVGLLRARQALARQLTDRA